MNANKYIAIPNKYKDLNPKYIELYSNNPPNIAPNILDDKAMPTDFSIDSSFEKANPEKKIGIVKIAGTIIFSDIEFNPDISIKVKK